MNSWDIIFWPDENAVDYIPSAWSNEEKTMYRVPVGPKMTDQKKKSLINECSELEEGSFLWYKAVCKISNITNLEKAKELCMEGQYTLKLESSEEIGEQSNDDEIVFVPIKKSKLDSDWRVQESCSYQRPESIPINMDVPIFDPSDGSKIGTVEEKVLPRNIRSNSPLSENIPRISAIVGAADNILSPTPSSSTSGGCDQCQLLSFEIKSLKEEMKEKFDVMQTLLLSIIEEKEHRGNASNIKNEIEQLLPLKSVEEVQILENKIGDSIRRRELERQLTFVGGQDLHKSVYNILKKLFTPELADQFSAFGNKAAKKTYSFAAFQQINGVLKDVVLKKHPDDATENKISKSIIRFFVSSKDRLKTS